MSIVAEACISVAVEGAICALLGLCQARLAYPRRQEDGEIDKWPDLLKQLQMVLHDAGSKQKRDPMVRTWLLELEHLVYDAEDILEDFHYHVLLRQHQRKRDKLREYASHPVSSFYFSNHIISQLKAITNKLFRLMEEKQELDLLATVSTATNKSYARPYAGCLIGDEVVYGREDEKNTIVGLLLDENTQKEIKVIPIVGMGGMGKTTLARYVFNDDNVVQNFDIRFWVCVSSDYDPLRITKSILEAALSRPCEITDLPTLQMKLEEAIKGTRFLLVLDDVWNRSHQDWNNLRAPFASAKPGSKVIVTTRLEEVADAMRTVEYKPLKKLDDDCCWQLFCRHANLDAERDEALQTRRLQISNKCNGLPLLAMALGGLLRYKRDQDWEDVLREECGDAEDRTRSVLKVSYYELPPDLKRCFVFCATFPAAHVFKENDLVLKWLGLGLVSWEGIREIDDEDDKGVERKELGHKYFRDLVSRSLFLPSGYSTRFVMHDLVRDVALEFSAMACCAVEKGASAKSQWFRTRHLSFHSDSLNTIAREIKAAPTSLPLRSFLHLNGCLNWNEQGKTLDSMLPHLKHLRLLSLNKSVDAEVPASIGALPHLRYLDLSGFRNARCASRRNLTKSIAVLYRLEILNLRECSVLQELPSNIGNLPSLKYLNASFTQIKKLPTSIANLRNLEYLILNNCDDLEELPSEIGSLQKLRQLNIAFTKVKDLPSSITKVIALEFLIARDCKRLWRLPDGIGALTKLRHLDIGGTEFVTRGVSSKGASELKSLRFLSDFVVGRETSKIATLGELKGLRGELKISVLENVGRSEDADGAKLWEKDLDSLTLKWSWSTTPQDTTIDEEVLERLRPNDRIKKLSLIGYCGSRVPSWMGNVNLKKLVVVSPPRNEIPDEIRDEIREEIRAKLFEILRDPNILHYE